MFAGYANDFFISERKSADTSAINFTQKQRWDRSCAGKEGGVHAMELACDVPFFLPSEGLFLVFLVVRGCLIGGCV